MKTLGKIKLNQFSKNELDQRKLNALKGGCDCSGKESCDCGGACNWDQEYAAIYSYYSDKSDPDSYWVYDY